MQRDNFRRARLMCGAAAVALVMPMLAHAEAANFNIPAQSLGSALREFSIQSQYSLVAPPDIVDAKTTVGVSQSAEPEIALTALLQGTGLSYRREGDTFLIVRASDPQSGSAAGDGADAGTVAALIVTAQKKEEQIQDVPIAISAFTEKSLEEQKIEGGFDLLKAIPNVTFSKNNFTTYNFSIRGVGTKAISATTDPGVSVAFNDSTLIRNRLFEQEYFDVERVEVLRGPQGTLYGRNATAGVINVISAKPNMNDFQGWLKGEVGNYHAKRISAMVNVPLVSDVLAIRLAGALTYRTGYDYNATTHHAVNGRDLWSGRVTVGFQPTDKFKATLIWERFNEDDDRSRTGKQLCHRDPGLSQVGSVQLADAAHQAMFSQGCKPGSLYDSGAFGTPNGLSIPFIIFGADRDISPLGYDANGNLVQLIKGGVDPYGGMEQSHDLRVINSIRDPIYRAATDVIELNLQLDLAEGLTAYSQTVYDKDSVYSFQDYNRFNTVPVFNDTSGLTSSVYGEAAGQPSHFQGLAPGGIYCDPQIGCSKSIAGFDISKSKSRQFSQEFRVSSSFKGPFNFSAGANYTRYRTLEDYYVMFNMITAIAQTTGIFGTFNYSADPTKCVPRFVSPNGFVSGFVDLSKLDQPVSLEDPVASRGCIYIDPNPVESINGEGHNYFRSKNPYGLSSAAVFGEVYWDVSQELKLTAGLRYTDDRKVFTPVPTQVLLSSAGLLDGTVDRGYPELPDIKQHWGEWTGRLTADWSPNVTFTDKTMLYATYSRGYKGGGANPPGIGFVTGGCAPFGGPPGYRPCNQVLPYPATFEPEFVNAFEIGTKNTALSGALTLNGDIFFYDYKNYQVSQIKDRTAVNENFDAKLWGLEFESLLQASRNLRFNFSLGYQETRIANGAASIDLMDRVQGHEGYVLVKPWVQLASNCVASVTAVEIVGQGGGVCPGGLFSWPLDPSYFPNGGAGFFADLGGKELPNAPHWTVSLGAQYSHDILDGSWRATVRGDAYWQSQSWARVYNDNPYDKLHGWYNVNLSLWLEKPDDGLKIEFYAKNLLDKTPITDAFLNSDDTALTTNVFVLDPRLIGLSIKKDF